MDFYNSCNYFDRNPCIDCVCPLAGRLCVLPEQGFDFVRKTDFNVRPRPLVNSRLAVVIDRSSDTLSWLQSFVQAADEAGVHREEIKVCFRENKDSETGVNEWIKLAGVGGKIEGGRIYIFEHKPAKWLFKDKEDITIIATNNLYPHTNQVTKDWLDSHPCVIYLGDIKPSEQKGKKIVEL